VLGSGYLPLEPLRLGMKKAGIHPYYFT